MRRSLLCILLSALLLGGCATTQYTSAEKQLENNQFDEAIRSYLKLLDPHIRNGKRFIYYDREAVTGIGTVYWHMGKYETSARILGTVVDKEPDFGKALFYLGLSMEGLGREDDAIDVYRRYYNLRSYDSFRQVLVGRMDWLVKKKIAYEIEQTFLNESSLNLTDSPEKSVAVLYFLSMSEDLQWKPLSKGLAEMIITDLTLVEELDVIERLRLNKIMEELNLSVTGLVEDDTAPRLGKLLAARHLVKGSYMVMPDLTLDLNAGIYQAADVLVPQNADFNGTLAQLFRMEKELVLRILNYFNVTLTPSQRERILQIPTENMMAFMSYCRGLDAQDRGEMNKAREFFRQALEYDPDFLMARDNNMTADLWDATHNRNLARFNRDVVQLVKTRGRDEAELTLRPPVPLMSSRNRLRWLGAYQNAGFLPGSDARKALQEADFNGVQLLPKRPLDEPPTPPNR